METIVSSHSFSETALSRYPTYISLNIHGHGNGSYYVPHEKTMREVTILEQNKRKHQKIWSTCCNMVPGIPHFALIAGNSREDPINCFASDTRPVKQVAGRRGIAKIQLIFSKNWDSRPRRVHNSLSPKLYLQPQVYKCPLGLFRFKYFFMVGKLGKIELPTTTPSTQE